MVFPISLQDWVGPGLDSACCPQPIFSHYANAQASKLLPWDLIIPTDNTGVLVLSSPRDCADPEGVCTVHRVG